MPVDPFESLREALKHSPDNVPLRQHLAEALLERGRAAEAEQEFRAALQLAPHHSALQIGLARAFHSQGKSSEAIVVLEEMLKGREMPGAAYVLLARLLYREGDVQRSVAMYRGWESPEILKGRHRLKSLRDDSGRVLNRRAIFRSRLSGPELISVQSGGWSRSRKRFG